MFSIAVISPFSRMPSCCFNLNSGFIYRSFWAEVDLFLDVSLLILTLSPLFALIGLIDYSQMDVNCVEKLLSATLWVWRSTSKYTELSSFNFHRWNCGTLWVSIAIPHKADRIRSTHLSFEWKSRLCRETYTVASIIVFSRWLFS